MSFGKGKEEVLFFSSVLMKKFKIRKQGKVLLDSVFNFVTMLHTVFSIAVSITLPIQKNECWHRKYLLLHLGFPFAK